MENVKTATNEVAKTENQSVKTYDLTKGNIPNLHKASEIPVELTSEYWTPEKENESKVGFFQKIENSTYTDEKTGESIELPCIIFIEQEENGNLKTIRNGSKRLVGAIEDALLTGKISQGTPLKINYIGKAKNKQNAFMSDRWSVRPLNAE